MSKLEQRLEQLDAAIAAYDVTIIEHCKWAGAKLREAVGIIREHTIYGLDESGVYTCISCYGNAWTREGIEHSDCARQKFLEG